MKLWSSKHTIAEKSLAEAERNLNESPYKETFKPLLRLMGRARANLQTITKKEQEDYERSRNEN